MNIDLDELEKLAKAASAKDALSFDEEDFAAYITPEIVCELINRLREAEKCNSKLVEALDTIVHRVHGYTDDYIFNMARSAIDAAKEQGNG